MRLPLPVHFPMALILPIFFSALPLHICAGLLQPQPLPVYPLYHSPPRPLPLSLSGPPALATCRPLNSL